MRPQAAGPAAWPFGGLAADLPLYGFGHFGWRLRREPLLEVLLSPEEGMRGVAVPVPATGWGFLVRVLVQSA